MEIVPRAVHREFCCEKEEKNKSVVSMGGGSKKDFLVEKSLEC